MGYSPSRGSNGRRPPTRGPIGPAGSVPWTAEAQRALELEMKAIEQRDREIRESRNAYPVFKTDRELAGCTCGNCDVIKVRNFRGDVVVTHLDGPCQRVPRVDGKPAPTTKNIPKRKPKPKPPAEPPARPDLYPEPPYAEIEQLGRWWWRITIHHGVMQWGPAGGGFRSFGKREWAEWKASRLLLQYWERHDRDNARREGIIRIG